MKETGSQPGWLAHRNVPSHLLLSVYHFASFSQTEPPPLPRMMAVPHALLVSLTCSLHHSSGELPVPPVVPIFSRSRACCLETSWLSSWTAHACPRPTATLLLYHTALLLLLALLLHVSVADPNSSTTSNAMPRPRSSPLGGSRRSIALRVLPNAAAHSLQCGGRMETAIDVNIAEVEAGKQLAGMSGSGCGGVAGWRAAGAQLSRRLHHMCVTRMDPLMLASPGLRARKQWSAPAR